jgi:hypothetical protein
VKRVLRLYVENRKIVMLTFEIFWIVVFLLHAAAEGGSDVTQLVYVNF